MLWNLDGLCSIIALSRVSSMMLNRSSEGWMTYSSPSLGENSQCSLLEMISAVGFYDALFQYKKEFYSQFSECLLSWNDTGFCQMLLLTFLGRSWGICFHSVSMVLFHWCFSDVKPALKSQQKQNWPRCRTHLPYMLLGFGEESCVSSPE